MNTDHVKLTVNGDVDVDYYLKLAHKLRQEEVARLTTSAASWFADVFHIRHDGKAHHVAH